MKLPLACGIIPHYVTHHNTRGINKTTTFQRHGKYMYSQIDRMFPLWSVDRSDEWQPVALVQQGENARREHLRNGHTQRLSTAPYDVRPIVVRDIANVRSRIHREGILQSKCSVTFSINYNNHSHAYFWLIFHRNK